MDSLPLLLEDDGPATLEAALMLIDECGPAGPGSRGLHSPLDVEPRDGLHEDFLRDIDHVVGEIPTQAHPNLHSAGNDSFHLNGAAANMTVSGSSSDGRNAPKRRRRTGAQEAKQLRTQLHELRRKLENMQLNARSKALSINLGPRHRSAVTFWSRAASRQEQRRKDSERENRRLRMVVSLYTRRAKQLERSWRKHMDTTELSRTIHPQAYPDAPGSNAVPADSPVVLARLMGEVEQLYAGIDVFLVSRRQQEKDDEALYAYSDSQDMPFDRHVVEQVVWRAIGYRATRNPSSFYRDDIRASDDSMSSSAHMIVGQLGKGLYVQMRVAGRKYRDEGRTVIVLRALVEPKHLESRASLGMAYQETHVRVVTTAGVQSSSLQVSGLSTTMDTHVVVTQHLPGNWTKPFLQSYPSDHLARSLWTRAVESRSRIIEDMLFEQTRQAGTTPV